MEILPQLLVNALITGSIYALAAAGLALSYGTVGVLNFAHGHLMMVGAYLFLTFHGTLEWGIPESALASVIALLGISTVAFRGFIRPFLHLSPILPFVTTLALATILESLVAMLCGVSVRSFPSSSVESIEWRGVFVTPTQIVIIVSAFSILALLALVLQFTPLGRRLRALSQNPSAAAALGIEVEWLRGAVFALGVVLAGYAGVMVGYETNLQPTMGGSYTMKAFAAMILGGLGNFWGTIAGSLFLGLVENLALGLDFGGYSIPAGYKDAVAFVAILLVLLFRPQGLFRRAGRAL